MGKWHAPGRSSLGLYNNKLSATALQSSRETLYILYVQYTIIVTTACWTFSG